MTIGRRQFLAGAPAAALAPALQSAPLRDRNCILLVLNGGPSHVDTWDPKAHSPFRAIRTNVPGIQVTELFPRMARHADKYSLVRSMHHDAVALHETSCHVMQTGRASQGACAHHPHLGCVAAARKPPRNGMPAHVLLGPAASNPCEWGQSAAYLGDSCAPACASSLPDLVGAEPETVRARYGATRFGRDVLQARKLVEAGVRFVTVNMFEPGQPSPWDAHGFAPFPSLGAYPAVAACFDAAFTALVEDLAATGLLEETVVYATGEFGRSPKLNSSGGRDHWRECWTAIIGGGGVKRGFVLGSSDRAGAGIVDRPVTPAEMAATLYRAIGVDAGSALSTKEGRRIPLIDPGVMPVHELLA